MLFNNQTFFKNLICVTGPSCLLSLLYLAFIAGDVFSWVSSNGVACPTMLGWWSMRKRQMERRWKNKVKERENTCWGIEIRPTKKQMPALFQERKEKDSEHKKGNREDLRLVKKKKTKKNYAMKETEKIHSNGQELPGTILWRASSGKYFKRANCRKIRNVNNDSCKCTRYRI